MQYFYKYTQLSDITIATIDVKSIDISTTLVDVSACIGFECRMRLFQYSGCKRECLLRYYFTFLLYIRQIRSSKFGILQRSFVGARLYSENNGQYFSKKVTNGKHVLGYLVLLLPTPISTTLKRNTYVCNNKNINWKIYVSMSIIVIDIFVLYFVLFIFG